MYKEGLVLNNLTMVDIPWNQTKSNQIVYIWYMYKKGLALNNLQRLICHKTKPNQIKSNLNLSKKMRQIKFSDILRYKQISQF